MDVVLLCGALISKLKCSNSALPTCLQILFLRPGGPRVPLSSRSLSGEAAPPHQGALAHWTAQAESTVAAPGPVERGLGAAKEQTVLRLRTTTALQERAHSPSAPLPPICTGGSAKGAFQRRRHNHRPLTGRQAERHALLTPQCRHQIAMSQGRPTTG